MKNRATIPTPRSAARSNSVMAHGGLLVLAVLVGTPACSRPIDASRAGPEMTAAALPPVRIVLTADQTLSMQRVWSAPVEIDDVRQVTEVVKERGGDLLFLVIRSNSGTTPGPTLHVDPPAGAPAKPPTGGDVFDAADAAERHRRVMAAYDERNRTRLAAADADIEAFLAAVETLLQAKPDRAATDISRMRARAARFFEDPDLPHLPPADRYLLVLSDGKDTADAVPVRRFGKPITVLLVSAAGPGVFAGDKPIVFSSIHAATRYLTHGGK